MRPVVRRATLSRTVPLPARRSEDLPAYQDIPMNGRRLLARIAVPLLLTLACGPVLAVGDADVRAELDTLPGGDAVESQVTDGIVTLTGTVADDAQRERIEEAVETLDGVKSVVSAILVE